MHVLHSSFLLVLTAAAMLPAQAARQTSAPRAALAEMVADGTKPQRLGELFEILRTADFATFGKELAREIGRPVDLGIGWATETPWLEPDLAPRTRLLGTLHRVWESHLQHPLAEGQVRMLWEILGDEPAGNARYLAACALLPLGEPEPPPVTDGTLERLERSAFADTSPRFRAYCLALLARHVAMDGHVDLAIEIARLGPDARQEQDLLMGTDILSRAAELTPVPRERLLRYAFDLLRRLDSFPPGTAMPLAVGLRTAAPPWLADVPVAANHDLALRYIASLRAHQGACVEHAVSGDAVWPFFPVHAQLVQRVHGTGTVQCRSQWRSLDDLPLVATGVWRLGARELLPLLPAELPITVGARWGMRGDALAALGRSLADMAWADSSGVGAWGWVLYSRRVDTSGELTLTCEQRASGRGLSLAGKLVLSESGTAGSRFGPNDLTSEARCELTAWLPLDARGAITAFEMQLRGDVAGRYGAEQFTQRLACTSAPGPLLTTKEQEQFRELLGRLGADEAATVKLVAMGPATAGVLVEAIAKTAGFLGKRQLTAVLRQVVGDAP
jgi:hypothetical protein